MLSVFIKAKRDYPGSQWRGKTCRAGQLLCTAWGGWHCACSNPVLMGMPGRGQPAPTQSESSSSTPGPPLFWLKAEDFLLQGDFICMKGQSWVYINNAEKKHVPTGAVSLRGRKRCWGGSIGDGAASAPSLHAHARTHRAAATRSRVLSSGPKTLDQ